MTVASPTPTPSGEQAGADAFKSAAGTSGGSGKVWLGDYQSFLAGRDLNSLTESAQSALSQRKGAPQFVSQKQAEEAFNNWDQKAREDFIAKGLIAGKLKFGDGAMEARDLWKTLVKESANYGSSGIPVSPYEILGSYVSAAGGGKSSTGGKGDGWTRQGDFEVNLMTGEKRYTGPQFETTTQSRIDLTDPATARAIATKIYQDLMGRNPGKGEIATFANALSQSEQSNPTQETTTTQYDMATGKPTSSNTVSRGGMSSDAKAMLAQDQVKGTKEYGAVQAATTYANALENAVYGAPR